MKGNKLLIPTVIVGALLVLTLVLGTLFTVGFVRNLMGLERLNLRNGEVLHLEEGGYRQIFLETTGSRSFNFASHEFVFTNTQTGTTIFSSRTFMNSSYNIGNVHGTAVASVDLPAGSWLVSFEPWQGSGDFVMFELAGGLARLIFVFVAQIISVSVAFLGLTTVLVLMILKLVKNKKQSINA